MPHRWSIRIVAALLLATAGIAGGAASLAEAIKSHNAQGAHRLAPWDGRITALVARNQLTADSGSAQQSRTATLARYALSQDPTAVAGASTLGLALQIRGDTAGARRIMHYAEQLSRRDLATQIWDIEDAVSRGDVGGALRHYDIALRTSRQAPAVLFPVLASAINDPNIRLALIQQLVKHPLWQNDFINYAATSGSDPRAVAQLFAKGQPSGIIPSETARAALLTRLVGSGAPEEAWRYYAGIRPGAQRTVSRNPRFATDIDLPLPFDWNPGASDGIAASIQSGPNAVFDFSAPSSVGGILLQQMQVLPAGHYQLLGHSRGVEEPEDTAPYWTLVCEGRELGRVLVTNSTMRGGAFGGSFTVPSDCPVQMLTLIARPSTKVTGLSGQIADIIIRPTRQ